MTRTLSMLALAALAAIGGCTLLLGENKDFRERDGGGGTGGATGTAGSNSNSNSAATVTSASASSSSGGPAMCHLLHDAEDCGAGHRCTIDSQDLGTTHCVPLMPASVKPFSSCAADTDCPAGTWCDGRTSTCAPFCAAANDCGTGSCIAARSSTAKTIPGASVCTAHCDPVKPSACGDGAACSYDATASDFDCFKSHGLLAGASCGFIGDCAPTYVCTSTCVKWCHPADTISPDCPAAGFCGHFSNLMPVYDGSAYGYCQ
jgi:hypothetical protein